MQKIIGIIIIFSSIIIGFILESGLIHMLWKPVEIGMIFGSAFGIMIITSKRSHLILLVKQMVSIFKVHNYNKKFYNELLSLMFELIYEAKSKNIKELDKHVEKPEDSPIFLRYPRILNDDLLRNFIVDTSRTVIASKYQPHEMEAILEEEILNLEKENKEPMDIIHKTGESLPGLGICVAILGIVLTMQNLDQEVTLIGKSISGALLGTFYGVFGCYCIFHPLASSLDSYVDQNIKPLYCIKSIIIAYLLGKSPHLCVNESRKHIATEYKPSFTELENTVNQIKSKLA